MQRQLAQQTAVVELYGFEYLLRSGDVGEPIIVVEAAGERYDPVRLKSLQMYANVGWPQLENRYLPNRPGAVAEIIAANLGGRLVAFRS